MNAFQAPHHRCIHGLAMLALLGACDPSTREDPATRLRGLGGWSHARAVSLGHGTTCAVTMAGDVKCWGRNDHGQLGQGHRSTLGDDETTDAFGFVERFGHPAREVHGNGEQTFVLLASGAVHAWGANEAHELGLMHDVSIGGDEPPVQATVPTKVELGGAAIQLAVGGDFACARLEGGGVRCWGSNEFGQLGQGHTLRIGDDEPPMELPTVDLGGPACDVAAGVSHACAVLETGAVRCWGQGESGRLGLGHIESIGDDELPSMVDAIELDAMATRVVAGEHHTCALLDTGAVRCWGWGRDGQLGLGHTESIGDDERPIEVDAVDLGGSAVDVAAGRDHTCAVLEDGGLRCWGSNASGQLGLGHTDSIGDDELPSDAGAVDIGTRDAVAVFGGPTSRSTCALLDDGGLRCWGANEAGQLGQGHVMNLGAEPLELDGDLPIIILIDDDDE